jgi:hypothetical protein
MKAILLQLFLVLFNFSASSQTTSSTFELRYFTKDPKANGETDFKGETEWMNTDQRIHFLNDYSNYASRFFGNPNLDQEIVSEKETNDVLAKVKPQPLTSIRQTIPLNGWKAYGYKDGQYVSTQKTLKEWGSYKGTSIVNGTLLLNNTLLEKKIDSLFWRFRAEASIKLEKDGACVISFDDGDIPVVTVSFKAHEMTTLSAGRTIAMKINSENWLKLVIEGDFTQKRFNLMVDGKQLQYYIPMADTKAASITKLRLHSKGKAQIDNLLIFNYKPVENVPTPYFSTVVMDEHFEDKPVVEGWQQSGFDDHLWKKADLPAVHGGIREKEEDFYLRKKIDIGDFERATLMLETIDPGGEVWVNGQVVAVINNRWPVELDVTRYLKRNSENLIAIKVNPNSAHTPSEHAPSDSFIGWFLGRGTLLLSNRCMIKDVQVHTNSIGNGAVQSNKIHIQYNGLNYFQGMVEVNYYPWFPEEGNKVATFRKEIQVRPQIVNEYDIEMSIDAAKLWSCNSPALYRVEVILKDKDGNSVDDYVTTTGIRIIEQKNGNFYVNGKVEMLNGAQIMGFRMPLETISKNSRCAAVNNIAEELLMIKKMGGNLLRMHVHAAKDTADGINDPRYAELADQMGVYLIWQTAAWLREGEVWNIDFEAYPKFIKQVYNHPSIVMWEAANHPNKFKAHDLSETNDYIKMIYDDISFADKSRLISPTSFWQHTQLANYDGTIDYKGNRIETVPEFMAELVTRGSQDAYVGYGNDWSKIRKAPNSWAASCLASKDKAYFNFEHEESIGQPNWSLCKGKPWFLLQSYEWEYDEGSIGRRLLVDEWKASQAWQAFSAWESMKKQIMLGYDGFSWCTLKGGANMGTYKKPLIDNLGHPKLAFYTNKMVFQKSWAASNNVDIVYGPSDFIKPIIYHLGDEQWFDLKIELLDLKGEILDKKTFKSIHVSNQNVFKGLEEFRFRNVKDGVYVIRYNLIKLNN